MLELKLQYLGHQTLMLGKTEGKRRREQQMIRWLDGISNFMDMLLLLLSLRSCPTLCDPIDGSPPGSPVPGILQARTPGWVAISFSNV